MGVLGLLLGLILGILIGFGIAGIIAVNLIYPSSKRKYGFDEEPQGMPEADSSILKHGKTDHSANDFL